MKLIRFGMHQESVMEGECLQWWTLASHLDKEKAHDEMFDSGGGQWTGDLHKSEDERSWEELHVYKEGHM